MATWLEAANKKLAELQKLLENSRYQLEIENLQISNDLNEFDKVRLALLNFRKILEREQQAKEVKVLQEAIHDALVAMTRVKPLNQLTVGQEMLCPLTLKVFYLSDGVALSNGCIYNAASIGDFAKDQKYFPRKLPGSEIEIDQYDLIEAQRPNKGQTIYTGLYAGMMAVMLSMIGVMALDVFTGINLVLLTKLGLIALGVGTGVATGLAVGAVLVPLLALVVIGGVLGAWYYSKHHPSQLSPTPANDGPSSSTALSFGTLDVKPEEKKEFKQELVEVQKLDDSGVGVGLGLAPAAPPASVTPKF